MKKLFSFFLILSFVFGLSVCVSSCGGSQKGYSKVKSGSGMGNSRHKNKHVWGK